MNDLIAKLNATIGEINAKQTAALTAAEADGVTKEAQAGHLAEFDKLQADKAKAQASLTRAEQLEKDKAAVAGPRTPPVVQPDIHNVYEATAETVTVPARAKRHGPLVVFKGEEKEAYMAGVWLGGALCGHMADFERAAAYKARARQMGMDFIEQPTDPAHISLLGLSNQSGGFFAPEIIESRIIEITQQYGVLRRLAEVVPMTSDTLTSPRWSAAMVAYFVGRGQKPAAMSDPAWNAIQLVAKDMATYTKIGRQINEDSIIDLAEKVTMNVGRAFAYKEDDSGFNGDGTSTYGGITGLITALGLAANSSCVITATGHTTVGALTNADFLNVAGAAPNYPGADWRWLCHKQFWAQSMANLALTAGGNRVDTVAAGPSQTLFMGYPVEFVNVMPKAPGTGAIGCIFADLKLAVKVGNRRGQTIQAGYENDDFTKQMMTLLGTQRVDVNCHTIADPLGDTNAPGGPVMALKLG